MISAWLPVGAYVVLVFTMSSISTLSPGDAPGMDKVAHFIEYGIMGLILARAWEMTLGRGRGGTRIVLVLMTGIWIAATDEIVQGFVGRDRSVYDWMADATGVTIAVLLDAWIRRRFGPSPSPVVPDPPRERNERA